MKPKLRILLFLLFSVSWVYGAHLVGGEMSYECLGNNQYQVTLKIYRDCNSTGAQFDPEARIGVFNASGNLIKSLLVPLGPISKLPTTVSNPCLITPPNVCTEMAVYIVSTTLPPIPGGYNLTYQRCCRNQTISNIPTPGSWGNTYTISIPSNDNACNSSPEFSKLPPIVLCLNDTLDLDFSVIELDGDSVYYELCDPLHGGSQVNPSPSPSPPPYAVVPFLNPHSSSFPLPSNPALVLNSVTGILSGKPNQIGQFVFAVCVTEYKNGVPLSTLRRDFQFNVTNCTSNASASIVPQSQFCSGLTVQFNSTVFNVSKYNWDFGDTTTIADTAVNGFPSYTYPDTGTYKVRLWANRGWSCSDSDYTFVKVHYPVHADYNVKGNPCIDQQGFVFKPKGNFSPEAKYFWFFGPNANLLDSRDSIPPPITFNAPGKYWVTMQVKDFNCSDVFGDTITVYDRPLAQFEIDSETGCAPYTVHFNNSSTGPINVNYFWDFGDGNTSTQKTPEHTYTKPGHYNVTLMLFSTEGCLDTVYFSLPNGIVVYPSPVSHAIVKPQITTIYNPKVEVIVPTRNLGDKTETYMGDGRKYTNETLIIHEYTDTGHFDLVHVVTNRHGCTDTLKIEVWIQTVPNIFVPNAFTPNNDGTNDVFLPSITGVREYEFLIFNRWGEMVFKTENTSVGWNGLKFNEGEQMPLGVYTYVINIKDQNFIYRNKTGVIKLIR